MNCCDDSSAISMPLDLSGSRLKTDVSFINDGLYVSNPNFAVVRFNYFLKFALLCVYNFGCFIYEQYTSFFVKFGLNVGSTSLPDSLFN